MKFLIQTCVCMALGLCFLVSADQLKGETVYSVTGFANNLGASPFLAPQVLAGETYVAEFVVDTSVADSNPASDVGVYAAAIESSSINFSGGYSSQVDFAGGTITIQQDNGGGGVFLNDALGLGSIVIYDLGVPFPSDALLTDPATQFNGSPASLFSLTEPTGLIVSASEVVVGNGTGPMAFSVSTSAVPEPSTGCLLGLGVMSMASRRRRS